MPDMIILVPLDLNEKIDLLLNNLTIGRKDLIIEILSIILNDEELTDTILNKLNKYYKNPNI